jgi:phosphoribosylformylglycinamidine synthase
MKVGIVVFPGSNCDEDAFHVAGTVLGHQPQLLWHKDHDLKGASWSSSPAGSATATTCAAERSRGSRR